MDYPRRLQTTSRPAGRGGDVVVVTNCISQYVQIRKYADVHHISNI